MCFDMVQYAEYSVCKHRVQIGRQRVSVTYFGLLLPN